MNPLSEKSIQSKILAYLTKLGAYSVKTISTNRAGVPDILACLKGRFVAIEVKRDGGKVSELQKSHIKKIRDAGGIAFVAYSVLEVEAVLIACGLVEGVTNVS